MAGSLPDILAPGLSVIFCGINPGTTAAMAGRHFVSRSNRFWRVLHLAGFTPVEIRPENDCSILDHGYGLTTAVARHTRRAGDLSRTELMLAAAELEARIALHAPRRVAFLGKAAYAAITRDPAIPWGPQPGRFGGAAVWVLPNPSGLNRNFGLAALVEAYRDLYLSLAAEDPAPAP